MASISVTMDISFMCPSYQQWVAKDRCWPMTTSQVSTSFVEDALLWTLTSYKDLYT